MLQTYILPIAKRIQETHHSISLRFSQPKVDRIPYQAGQYITLKVEIEGETHFRSYSMSSTPKLDDSLAITIKKVPGGLVSNHIHNHWRQGSLVEFLRPAGRFIADFAIRHRRHLIGIAGGSGITPVFSILKGILFQEPYSRFSLLYANSTESDIIFKDQLEELRRKFPDRFDLTHVISRPEEEISLPHIPGRIDKDLLENWLQSLQKEERREKEFYLCGPEGLMTLSKGYLQEKNVNPDSINLELFLSNPGMLDRQKRTLRPAQQVSVRLGDKVHNIWVPSGATILEAAISQGIKLPYSCKRGVCATCMGKLLSGEVIMDDPTALLDFEIDLGKMLVCQAIPTDENVHIHMGV